jgi:hypothetical protein
MPPQTTLSSLSGVHVTVASQPRSDASTDVSSPNRHPDVAWGDAAPVSLAPPRTLLLLLLLPPLYPTLLSPDMDLAIRTFRSQAADGARITDYGSSMAGRLLSSSAQARRAVLAEAADVRAELRKADAPTPLRVR